MRKTLFFCLFIYLFDSSTAQSMVFIEPSATPRLPRVVNTTTTVKKKLGDAPLVIPSSIEVSKPFVIQNIQEFPDNELFVFDKTGNLVYHAEYYNNDWDGKKEDGTFITQDEMCYYVLDDGRGVVHTGYLQVILK